MGMKVKPVPVVRVASKCLCLHITVYGSMWYRRMMCIAYDLQVSLPEDLFSWKLSLYHRSLSYYCIINSSRMMHIHCYLSMATIQFVQCRGYQIGLSFGGKSPIYWRLFTFPKSPIEQYLHNLIHVLEDKWMSSFIVRLPPLSSLLLLLLIKCSSFLYVLCVDFIFRALNTRPI